MEDSSLADMALAQFFTWGTENLQLDELLHTLILFSILDRNNRTRVRRFLLDENCLQAREVFSKLILADATSHVNHLEQVLSQAYPWLREEDERLPLKWKYFCSLGRYRFRVGMNVSSELEFRGRRVELFVASGDVTLFRVAFNDQVRQGHYPPRIILMGPPSRNLGSVRNVEFVDHRVWSVGTGPTYTRGDTLLFDKETNEYHEGPGVYERALVELRVLEAQFREQLRSLVPHMLPFSSDIKFGYLRFVYKSNKEVHCADDIGAWADFLRSLSRIA